MRAFTRSWGRDVMLYTGGVSFFALLAVFPAIAILIGFYKAVLTISQVSEQAAALADVLPHAARTITTRRRRTQRPLGRDRAEKRRRFGRPSP